VFQLVQMISLCFSVLTAAAAVVIVVRALRLLELAKGKSRDRAHNS